MQLYKYSSCSIEARRKQAEEEAYYNIQAMKSFIILYGNDIRRRENDTEEKLKAYRRETTNNEAREIRLRS